MTERRTALGRAEKEKKMDLIEKYLGDANYSNADYKRNVNQSGKHNVKTNQNTFNNKYGWDDDDDKKKKKKKKIK